MKIYNPILTLEDNNSSVESATLMKKFEEWENKRVEKK